ncbi:hypothetical protein C5D98_14850 [Rathayibacter rathayi]|uniref:hypothetical protein n=1 Tax=Rathayibacter rathayi TaxID=33887 RepID=UPI000CE92B96|nr:hypothetical protein [Rathayibacter rathayi]PPG77460.1 hypothetical protein C5C15_09195 [Rathayibacter rathayi]PPI65228.1 hypothetical protein C5D98_14850 [Rathayibacter rathayi]
MTTTDPFNQEIVTAATRVTELLSMFVNEGLAEDFFGSLNFADALVLADLAAAVGDYPTARETLREWEANDQDSDEHAVELAWAIARYTEREHAA